APRSELRGRLQSMKRRDLILGASAVLLVAIARAQTPRRYRLGIFNWSRESLWDGGLPRILDELGGLGYARGVRLEVHERYVGKKEDIDLLPRELAAMPVDAILTEGTPLTLAAQRATGTIPIVTRVGDPV